MPPSAEGVRGVAAAGAGVATSVRAEVAAYALAIAVERFSPACKRDANSIV
jgi:hypothetical protein